jgi:hypothetical protein
MGIQSVCKSPDEEKLINVVVVFFFLWLVVHDAGKSFQQMELPSS